MNNPSNIDQLREIVRDDARPGTEREVAAELLITELVDAVQMPSDDDDEVVAHTQPWLDGAIKNLFNTGPAASIVNGKSLTAARTKVHEDRRLRAVLAIVVDDSTERLERLAACRWLLKTYSFIRRWAVNHYTPERLLETVLTADAHKWTSQGKRRVDRPAKSLQDVWSL
ncbi:hypothetical protein [Terriglobus sp. TAA 43]|uniref:hypothetical protein n=1 Tax=Terriglobus sp. TAA 43 TaxID=278961 RepID=UPI0006479AD3|nr:hypothetical protein [Terriglobus sp. TAA 43]